ncbi:MAG: DUF3500 domain-containing protein [Candidatus Latescibacteria bacterium]|nr:DUF3500 domain-containing protein [Candidatus Latescibacterota bacterium]
MTEHIYRMAEGAQALLKSLSGEQLGRAAFAFDEKGERTNWHFVPRHRAGLPLREMDEKQRRLALALVATGLSVRAYQSVGTIMQLEGVLAQTENEKIRANLAAAGLPRDPDGYFISLFGDIGHAKTPWGWRFEGHHISLNFTIRDNQLAATPLFLGANPAQVAHGQLEGVRPLKEEEELAYELLHQFDGEQRRQAIFSSEAKGGILTGNAERIGDVLPDDGLSYDAMNAGQRQVMAALVGVFAGRQAEPFAMAYKERMQQDIKTARFAWAGAVEPGAPHYYRIDSSGFLVEFDNTQNDANHIHTVWRDRRSDFGGDLLGRHYSQSH